MTTRAEKRRQMRLNGFHRAEGKNGRRPSIRPVVFDFTHEETPSRIQVVTPKLIIPGQR